LKFFTIIKKPEKNNLNISDQNNIKEYEEILGDSFTEFVEYWCEPNKNGKLRYELEKFFDIKRRVNTWLQNKNKYGNSKNTDATASSRKRMDDLAKWINR
jgi:hypothetical protein